MEISLFAFILSLCANALLGFFLIKARRRLKEKTEEMHGEKCRADRATEAYFQILQEIETAINDISKKRKYSFQEPEISQT